MATVVPVNSKAAFFFSYGNGEEVCANLHFLIELRKLEI